MGVFHTYSGILYSKEKMGYPILTSPQNHQGHQKQVKSEKLHSQEGPPET